MYFLYVFSIFYMYFKSHLIFDWVQKQMTVLNELYLALKRSEKGISTRIMTDNLSNYEFLELVGLVTLNSSIYNWSLTIYSTNRKRKSVPAPREWLHFTLQTTSIGTVNSNCALDAKPHGPERNFRFTVDLHQYVESCWIVLERPFTMAWENTVVFSFFVC